jgi:protein Tob/BTG
MLSRNLPIQFIKPFSQRLEELLARRYKDHWHPGNPRKGSAYRCIRINGKMDPVVSEAAKVTGLSNIAYYLPKEFTLWIDPSEVSYRFGEEGSICQCPLNPHSNEDFPFSKSLGDFKAKDCLIHEPQPTFFDLYPTNAASASRLPYETPISVQV